MAVAIVGTVTKGEGTVTTLTIAHTVPTGTDRLLSVGVSAGNAHPTGITWNTTETLTSIVSIRQATGGSSASKWRRIAPTEVAANVVVTFAAAEEVVAGVVSLTGVDQTTPVTSSNSSTPGEVTSVSLTVTSATDELCIDTVSLFEQGAAFAANVGQTERWKEDNEAAPTESGGGSSEPGAASVTMGWSWTSATFPAYVAVAYKAAAAGGAVEKLARRVTPHIGEVSKSRGYFAA